MRPALTHAAVDALRLRLTHVATQLFVDGGVEALSLRNLAANAGMSRCTPYTYFRNKQEIVDGVRAAGLDRLTACCVDHLDAANGPMAQMRALSEAVVAFALREPAVYQLIFSGPVFSAHASPVLAAAVERFRAVSRPPLDQAVAWGLVRGDADTLRRVTWAAFHGLVMLHLQSHSTADQLGKDVDALNQVIGHGVLVGAHGPASSPLQEPQA